MYNSNQNQTEDTRKSSFTYADLLEQLNQYKAKTDDEIKAAAEAQVNSQYDAAKLNAQQAADKTTLALQQQLESLAPSYDRQLEESRKAYEQAYSKVDRQALSRGMQRSSYNAQVLANLLQEGNKAAGDIQAQRTAQEANINANISQTAQQLAEQLAQMETARASDLKAAEDALRDQEYNRNQAQNELLLNLYQLAEQGGHNKGTGVGSSGVSSGGSSYTPPSYVSDILGYTPGGTTAKNTSASGSSANSSKSSSGSSYDQLTNSLKQQINYTKNGTAQTYIGEVPTLIDKQGNAISNNAADWADGATGKTPDLSTGKVPVSYYDTDGKLVTIYV